MDPPPSITGLSDIEALGRVPLEQCDPPSSTYELLQRSAQYHSQHIALSCLLHGSAAEEPSRIGYAELFARVTQTADVLHRPGLESHQAASFLLLNLPQTYYVIWSGEAVGIIDAINPLLEPGYTAELICASNTRVLVALAPLPGIDLWQEVAGLRTQSPELYAIVVVDPANLLSVPQRKALKAQRGPLPEGVLDSDTLIVDYPADRLESGRAIHLDDVAPYFHTGNTIGTSKLAPYSHFNEVATAEIMGLNAGYGVDGVLLCSPPLLHVSDVIVTGLAPFHRGAQVLLAGPQGYHNPTLTQDLWKPVERYRVTSFSGVSTIYTALLQVSSGGRNLSNLRFALCGMAPVPMELIHQLEARTRLRVIEGYGLAEDTCSTSYNPRGGERRPGSTSLHLPYCQVKVVMLDGKGNYLRGAMPNETGNFCLEGPAVFEGYPRQDRNRDIWTDNGWFNTGDLGCIDEDGYIWLTGRSEDSITRDSRNTDPQMIEEALHRHPVVALAVAVGEPNAKAGKLPVAYIQFEPGTSASEKELLEHTSRHIPECAAASKDVRLIESMSVTAMGKISKPALCLDAIRRVLEEENRRIAEDIRVETVADERHGQLAYLYVPTLDERRWAVLEELLGDYTLNYRPHAV